MKYILGIDGMRCGMCECHVNDIVRKTGLVKSVKSSHRKNQTVIKSKEEIDIDRIKADIEALGYHVLTVIKEE